jgi:hypothetical protein
MKTLKALPLVLALLAAAWLAIPPHDHVTPDDVVPGPDEAVVATDLIVKADRAYWNRYADFCDDMGEAYPDGWPLGGNAEQEWSVGIDLIRGETHVEIVKATAEAAASGKDAMRALATKIREESL